MTNSRDKLIEATLRNQADIRQARLSRRELLKLGLIGSGGLLVAKSGLSLRAFAADGSCGPSFDPIAPCVSPVTKPFMDPLRIPSVPKAVALPSDDSSYESYYADYFNAAPNSTTGWSRDSAIKAPHWDKHKGIQLGGNRCNPIAAGTHAKCYRQFIQEAKWQWHSQLGNDTAWVFDKQFPGPTFLARHKEPVFIRRFNCLDPRYINSNKPIPGGFGSPWPSTHLHNFHSADQSDGGPWELRRLGGKDDHLKDGALTYGMFGPGDYHDYHYTMAWAGFTDANAPENVDGWGCQSEAMNTLWYHDHCKDFTSQNVYKGMAGMFWIFDKWDSGNEWDGLRFPSGPGVDNTGYGCYDIPLVLSDRMFNAGGESVFPLFNLDGVIGDKYTVNGCVQPFFEVKPRRYRFRVLAIGPSRIYRLAIVRGNKDGTGLSAPLQDAFCMISNQGNLIPYPVITDRFNICPAERFDVLIDFAELKARSGTGDYFFLVNLMEQTDGRGPSYKDMKVPGLMMRFDPVLSMGTERDASFNYFAGSGTRFTGPTGVRAWVNKSLDLSILGRTEESTRRTLCTLPSTSDLDVSKLPVNTFLFDRKNGNWTVNGRIFNDESFNGDPNIIKPQRGQPQVWVIKATGNWSHPVHIHFEEGQVISYNGVSAAAIESRGPFDDRGRLFTGRRDVYCVGPNDVFRVLIRFRDFCDGQSRYPMHCHNVVHEDHAMMMRFDI